MTPDQFSQIIREAVKDELVSVKEEIADSKNDILLVLDDVVKKVDIVQTELLSNQVAHDRFEKRITSLEDSSVLKVATS